MQVFAYAATALWMVGNLFLGSWAFYLSIKMEGCRLPKQSPMPTWGGGGRKFAFQKDASDFTETGQVYRRKAIKVECALFIWAISVPLALQIMSQK
jgi:hypothetical protein